MSLLGLAVLNALERGPMTIDEMVLETGLAPKTIRDYALMHLFSTPPKIHVAGAELAGRSLRVVAIFGLGPAKEIAA